LNKWIEHNYNELVRYARAFTPHPIDLVNHVYIKTVNANFEFRSPEQTEYYFKKSIKHSGTCGDFSKQYKIKDTYSGEAVQVNDFEIIEMREQIDEVVRYLDEFDREVFELYLSNQNISEFCKESGVSPNTVKDSIKKTRELIKYKLQ